MSWLEDVQARAKRKNKVLFMPGDSLFDGLAMLAEQASRLALVLWALSLAGEAVLRLEELLPEEPRPREALRLARLWARGEVKMPIAKRAILDCHAVAKESVSPEAAALCHAVGQACAVVHARGHALGFAFTRARAGIYSPAFTGAVGCAAGPWPMGKVFGRIASGPDVMSGPPRLSKP